MTTKHGKSKNSLDKNKDSSEHTEDRFAVIDESEEEDFPKEDEVFRTFEGGDAESRGSTLTRKDAIDILQTTRDFSGLDFRKANLSKLDFAGCIFENTNLSYVNFKDANLEGCRFNKSSLWNANLEGANLTRADLEDADLDYSKLRGAIMYRANIKRTTLPVELVPREDIMLSVEEGTRITH